MILQNFKHLATHNLLYDGDCRLLGITADGFIYAEELYGDDDWLAQHRLSLEAGIIESVDEAWGNNQKMDILALPENLIRPYPVNPSHPLNYSGARLRGIRSEERIDDLVQALDIKEKIEVIDYMEWDIDPMQLLGIAESVVLAQTAPIQETSFIVCRRLRLIYTLPQLLLADDGDYDYDALSLYLLHEYNPQDKESPSLLDCLDSLDDTLLLRPMDCLYHQSRIYIADGGEDEDVSAIHIFELESVAE